jgi:hypothetical protein
MYDLAMTIYFGMYGATMTTNSELFWGPDSIMMLPARDTASNTSPRRRRRVGATPRCDAIVPLTPSRHRRGLNR